MPDATPTPATYSLVSWVRRGLASLVTGQPAVNYSTLPVSVSINGSDVAAPPVRLLGPGDITGLDARSVIRTDPRAGADTFEPNYLAIAELSQPDMPWMFTPAGPTNGRLHPWICLVVVPDGPGASLASQPNGLGLLRLDAPLDPKAELPDLSTIDLWAHAQVAGQPLSGDTLNAAFDGDPSATLSRLVSPRRLQPLQNYIACIAPTYHAGVNAALGLPVDDNDLLLAWDASITAPFVLPVYYSFRFRTGPGGDFASLAHKITSPTQPLDAGTRDMNVSAPGFGIAPMPTAVLGLEGALRTVGNQSTAWPAGVQTVFEAEVRASLVPPPISTAIAPPTYGSAQTGQTLPVAGSSPTWLSQLNLDPRTRVAASAGTQVMQENRDALLAAAWDQPGEVLKVNRFLRQAQLARQVTTSLSARHLQTIPDDGVLLQITSPVHSRVLLAGATATLRANIQASRLPASVTSAALRKMARPAGQVGRQLSANASKLVERLNTPPNATSSPAAGALQVAVSLAQPRGMAAFDDIAQNATPTSSSSQILISKLPTNLASQVGWVKDTAIASGSETTTTATKETGHLDTNKFSTEVDTSGKLSTSSTSTSLQTAAPLVNWSANPNLPAILASARADLPAPLVFPSESNQFANMQTQFRTAAGAVNQYLQSEPAAAPPAKPLGGTGSLSAIRGQLLTRIDPQTTIQMRVASRVPLNTGPDPLEPPRFGPSIAAPMYRDLADLSPEWMLPGISEIPDDCAALLAPNASFIESYMIGLNEEFSRDLLWQQYPVDLTATAFQNFWTAGTPDIPAIRTFGSGLLGTHLNDRSTGNALVFLVRANLFRRYPNAVVCAIKAVWNGSVRTLSSVATDQQLPDFRGEMGTDITFFGFQTPDALGSSDPAAGRPGWYFVIEEHITEPRFGLEPDTVVHPAAPPVWNDLSWNDLPSSNFLSAVTAPGTSPTRESVGWGQNSAAMSYILMRKPVRVAFHAAALIGPLAPGASQS